MSNQNLPVVVDFSPINPVPEKAPAPPIDLQNPFLSFDDVLPANYFSMERLQEWLDEREAESRILTISAASMEYVFDPEKGVESGEWKPCLSFAETATMLVINVSRGKQLKAITGSPFMKDWGASGRQVAIKPGIADSKAQIIIKPIPGGTTHMAKGQALAEDPEPEWAQPAANGNGKGKANGRQKVDETNEALFG